MVETTSDCIVIKCCDKFQNRDSVMEGDYSSSDDDDDIHIHEIDSDSDDCLYVGFYVLMLSFV